MLIDIHCHHVNQNPYSIITLDQDSSIPAQNYFNYGIHPWQAESIDLNNISKIIYPYSSHSNFLMLGEVGLDRACKVNFRKQVDLFEKQLLFANEQQINVLLIHCVRSLNDILSIVKALDYKGRLVFHDSNFSNQEIEQVTAKGYYLSFGDNLFRENSKASKSIANIDSTKLFLESGDGHNSITDVYTKTASLLQLNQRELDSLILKNFQSLFCDRNITFDFN